MPQIDRYRLVIWWSDDDELFLAQIPDLPGCMAHGHTPEQALKEIRSAGTLYLEVCAKDGRPIPEPQRAAA